MQNASGILIAVLYSLAAVFSIFFAMEERKRKASLTCQVVLVLLGLVLWLCAFQEATGLLSGVTQLGRSIARADHWYAQRREYQGFVVVAIPFIGLTGLCALAWLVRREWKRYIPVVIALTYLICSGAIQAVSLHQIDYILRKHILGIRLRDWGDIIGLSLAFIALFWLVKTRVTSARAARS